MAMTLLSSATGVLAMLLLGDMLVVVRCQGTMFSVLRATASGPALCGLDSPARTDSVDTLLECSVHCQNDPRCSSFNYVQPSPPARPRSSCQLFECQQANFAVVPGCTNYQVYLTRCMIAHTHTHTRGAGDYRVAIHATICHGTM